MGIFTDRFYRGLYCQKSPSFLKNWMELPKLELFLRNVLQWGYSNAAVVPCVRPSVHPCMDIVNTIETTPLHVSLSNLADMLTMMRGWTLLILEVSLQSSKVKVIMDIYGNKLVNTIETKPLCISLSNLADMLTMVRGWTLLISEVRGQRSRSQWTYMEISLWTR